MCEKRLDNSQRPDCGRSWQLCYRVDFVLNSRCSKVIYIKEEEVIYWKITCASLGKKTSSKETGIKVISIK